MSPRNNSSNRSSQPFPSGRYTHTNPLRRESGLQKLTETLPEPIRAALFNAWRHPANYDGNQAIQSAGARAAGENAGTQFPQAPAAAGAYRQRPNENSLPTMPPRILDWIDLIELGVSRRILEAPIASIKSQTRDRLLTSQGHYLRAIYNALCIQLGSPEAATAHVQHAIDTIY